VHADAYLISDRLGKGEQRKGTSSWRTLWPNFIKNGVAGLEVEQPGFELV
jgi:hypothetical protein